MKFNLNIHQDENNFICTEAIPQTEALAIVIDFLTSHKESQTPINITLTPAQGNSPREEVQQ